MAELYETEPCLVYPVTKEDELKYAFAYCNCPLPLEYGLKIPKEAKYIHYNNIGFKCKKCGLQGTVHINNFI